MRKHNISSIKRIILILIPSFIIFICTIVLFSSQLISEHSNQSGNENTDSNESSIQKQIEVIADHSKVWAADAIYGEFYYYTVTDLNQNGRLELIFSNIGGSGYYSYSTYYEVNETLDGLKTYERNAPEGDSQADIADADSIPGYYDSKTGIMYYVFDDSTPNGLSELYENKRAISLENGKTIEMSLAFHTKFTNDEKTTHTYRDAKQNTITETEYNNIADYVFVDLEKKDVTFQWNEIEEADDVCNKNRDELIGILTNTYEKFTITPSQNSVDPSEAQDFKESTDVSRIENQIEVITDHIEQWGVEAEYANDMYSYAVTDLNQNGRLEIIASNCGGNGYYTYSKYYEINEIFDGLVEYKRDTYEDDSENVSEADIVDYEVPAYYDGKTGIMYYIFQDESKNGAGEHYANIRAISLEDNKIVEKPLAYYASIYKNSVEHVKYEDSKKNEITEDEYNNMADQVFVDLEKKQLILQWNIFFKITELKDKSHDELITMLTNSYGGFVIKDANE